MSPEAMELNVQGMIDTLGTRKAGGSKVAHVLQDYGGRFWCLDLDIRAATRDELSAAIVARYASITPDTILTPAPAHAWRRFIAARNSGTWLLLVQNSLANRGFRVCVRTECL